MAVITPGLLQALLTGFRRDYQNGLQLVEPQYSRVASVVPSTTVSNTYGWLGQMPGFSEWVGERTLSDISSHGYSITNKSFANGVKVKGTDIEDDQIGIYSPLFQELGRSATLFPDELVFGLLKQGDATLCYDGQNYFDTEHPVYAKHDGTGDITPVSNVTAGAAEPWYLLDVSRAIKPIIFQSRKTPQLTAMTQPTDESVFMEDVYRYGVDLRCNVGFGFWQMGHKASVDLTPANFAAVRTKMKTQKANGGKPLAINPRLLVVPPGLETKALEVLKAERLANGASNIYQNMAEVMVCDWLA